MGRKKDRIINNGKQKTMTENFLQKKIEKRRRETKKWLFLGNDDFFSYDDTGGFLSLLLMLLTQVYSKKIEKQTNLKTKLCVCVRKCVLRYVTLIGLPLRSW